MIKTNEGKILPINSSRTIKSIIQIEVINNNTALCVHHSLIKAGNGLVTIGRSAISNQHDKTYVSEYTIIFHPVI